MNLRVSDLPRPWRAPAALALFIVMVLGAAWGGVIFMRSVARAEAREVVREDREQFKSAALEAARAGAREAVSEAVEPVLRELRVLDARYHETQRQNERRLETLEARKP